MNAQEKANLARVLARAHELTEKDRRAALAQGDIATATRIASNREIAYAHVARQGVPVPENPLDVAEQS